MNKIAVGPEAAGSIDITASPSQNLRWIAKAKRASIGDITVVILDRPRHEELIREVRQAGARVKLITDGDVAAAVTTALPDTGVDVLMGIGGAPEAVLAAAALKCLDGEMQCTLWPRDDKEREACANAGLSLTEVYDIAKLVGHGDTFFAATGITDGELLQGVHYFGGGATTESLVMRSYSGTVRWISARHNFRQLDKLVDEPHRPIIEGTPAARTSRNRARVAR
jgi:fructose-1,6-bisphosphatase II